MYRILDDVWACLSQSYFAIGVEGESECLLSSVFDGVQRISISLQWFEKKKKRPCLEWLVMQMRRSINILAAPTNFTGLIACRQRPKLLMLYSEYISNSFWCFLSIRALFFFTVLYIRWTQSQVCLKLSKYFCLFLLYIVRKLQAPDDNNKSARQNSPSELHRHTKVDSTGPADRSKKEEKNRPFN